MRASESIVRERKAIRLKTGAFARKNKKRGAKKLVEITPEQLVDAALDTTDPNVITEQHRAVLREMMLPLLNQTEGQRSCAR